MYQLRKACRLSAGRIISFVLLAGLLQGARADAPKGSSRSPAESTVDGSPHTPPAKWEEGDGGAISRISFSPDGKQILAIRSGGQTSIYSTIWDSGTGKMIREFQADFAFVVGNISGNARFMVTAYRRGSDISVWDIQTGKRVARRKENFYAHTVTLSTDGTVGLFAGSLEGDRFSNEAPAPSEVPPPPGRPHHRGTVRLWDARTGKELRAFKPDKEVSSAALSPDGSLVACGCQDGTIRVFESKTGKEAHHLRAHSGPVTCLLFTPDGKRLLSGDSQDPQLAGFQETLVANQRINLRLVLARQSPQRSPSGTRRPASG